MNTRTKQISTDQFLASPLCRFDYAGQFSDTRDVPMHHHEGAELVLICSGRCAIDIDGGPTLPAESGTLCIIPAGAGHNQRHFELTCTSYVTFFAQRGVVNDTARTVQLGADSMVSQWIAQMNILQTQGPDKRQVAQSLLETLLRWLNVHEHSQTSSDLIHPALVRATAFVQQKMFTALSVEEIAQHAFVSPGYLIALFRKQFGAGPLHYQQQLRMDRARQLLAAPYLGVSQVAAECGYDDPNYFGRVFRAHTGLSPRAFRKVRLEQGGHHSTPQSSDQAPPI